MSVIVAGCIVAVVALAGAGVTATEMPNSQQYAATPPTENVSEEAYEEPAPGPDDQYFEAAHPDGDWVSYVNPRDKYRSPYLGDGSGKICVTLVNEEGEFVEGQSIPDTTVEVPTGDSLEWHTYADPFTVEYPLTENYERPLDADQFGTSPDLAQGDGYMDSHCMEIHGMPEDGTIEYGEASLSGEHADDVEVVGYIQQANEGWDTDIDPIEDAESYEEAGGGWTYYPDGSHGQVVVVLQLDGADGGSDTNGSSDANDGSENSSDDSSGENGSDDAAAETIPGLGILTALAALIAVSLLRLRR
ncbi:PGF-CTERM sorting domain-containing protein [Halostagnicola sp. A-GB9-2]|uniref:PGF-CTERM sorting domain-containing protein n=1 Tax=Halostagnicola sp. A-GB9-2 TaxID=3048066 RepID=UPI0024BFD98D|nr:PGF-CTERM sorting domain-containing protein [Halostagnicola sp. A-GB9-2]MDJ1431444.1 PGF-CTERM sorting domain-containing protein [Halostagnicola sp. A-GB9-2]